MNKAGHTDSKVKDFIISKIKELNIELKLKLRTVHLYAMFTFSKEGLLISLYGQLEIGRTFVLEFTLGKHFKFEVSAGVTINFRVGATLHWTFDGLYIKSAEIYYPWLTAQISSEIKFKFKVGEKTKEKKFGGPGIEFNYYFPPGATEPTTLLKGEWDIDSTKLSSANVTFFYRFMRHLKVLIDPVGTATSVLGINLLKGETEIINSSINDMVPPSVAFLTAAYSNDPVTEWNVIDTPPEEKATLYARTLTESGEYQDVDITNSKFISSDMCTNGSIALTSYEQTPIPLVGDNASILLYAFDEHEGDNYDSTIRRINVHAEFPTKVLETVNIQINSHVTTGTFKYEPITVQANMRVYYSGWLQDRIVYFKDDQGRIITKIGGISVPGYRALNFTGWTPFAFTQWITIEVEDLYDGPVPVPDENYVHEFNPDGFIEIKLAEVQFFSDWDTTYSDTTNGKIILDHTVDDGPGIGKWANKTGYSAWYNLEIPLHKLYRDNLIPESGWIEFTLFAEDSSGWLSKPVTKKYYYVIPGDTIGPEMTPLTSNLVKTEDFETPPITISRTGYQNFDINIEEQVEYVSYQFNYAPYTSTYDVHTGLANQGSDQVSIWKYDSRVIKTSGSSTANGYWFDIYRPITNTNETFIGVDLRSTDNFQIYIRVKSDVSITYMTYKEFTGDPYVYNGYLFTPTIDINTGNWTRFYTNIQLDLRRLFPTGNITEVEAFLIRGSYEIDNIMLNGEVLEDAEDGDTNGWKVYDSDPAGAQITNIPAEKIHELSVPSTWTKIGSSTDSQDRIMTMHYRLGLDTSNLPNGRYIVFTSAYDVKGNGNQEAFWIYIDHTNPNNPSYIKFIPQSYTPGYDSSDSPVQLDPETGDPEEPVVIPPKWEFTLEWGASSDNLGVKCYKIYHDDNFVAETSTTSYSITFNDQDEILGTWVIKAFDYAGNYGSKTLTISSLPDYDADSLDDFYELAISMTNPKDSDSDNDGLNDGQEVLTYHTDPKKMNIYGYVKSTTGAALAGVTIQLKTSSGTLIGTVTSSSDGWYISPSAANLLTQSYTLTFSLTDYVTKTVTIYANPSTCRKDVTLTHATTYYTGQVTSSSGAGLNDVKVEIIDIDTGSVIATTYSGTVGFAEGWYTTYEVYCITGGYYQLRFSKSGYVTKIITVSANPSVHSQQVSLLKKVYYAGYVKNIAGIGLSSARVQIKTTAGTIINTVYTSSTGYYCTGYVNPIVNGIYRLNFYKYGYVSKTIDADADEGYHSYSVTLSASSTITIYGYVKSTTGAAISGAKVVIKASNGYTLATVYTSTTGYYSAVVSKGLTSTYTVTASRYNYVTKTYSVYSTSSIRRDFSLTPSSIIISPF
ncbi:MAG: MSCRAMM family protein [Candidatus Hodarchaeales archaeon]